MEEMKEKKNKYILIGVISFGILLIICSLLIILIPSLTTPNYRLYKNGVDYTDDYLLISDRNTYSYNLSNADDEAFFNLETYDKDENSHVLASINLNGLYNNNNLTGTRDLALAMSFTIAVEEGFAEINNDDNYILTSIPSLFLTSSLSSNSISSSYALIGDNSSYTFNDIQIDNFTNDQENYFINIVANNNLRYRSLADGSEVNFALEISDISLMFFAS